MLLSVQGTGWHLVHTCCIRFRKDIHSLVAGIITSRDSLDNNRNNQASWIKTLDVSLSYRSQGSCQHEHMHSIQDFAGFDAEHPNGWKQANVSKWEAGR